MKEKQKILRENFPKSNKNEQTMLCPSFLTKFFVGTECED